MKEVKKFAPEGETCDACGWDDVKVHLICGYCNDCCNCKPIRTFRAAKTRRSDKEFF